jgi:hypothetical protein
VCTQFVPPPQKIFYQQKEVGEQQQQSYCGQSSNYVDICGLFGIGTNENSLEGNNQREIVNDENQDLLSNTPFGVGQRNRDGLEQQQQQIRTTGLGKRKLEGEAFSVFEQPPQHQPRQSKNLCEMFGAGENVNPAAQPNRNVVVTTPERSKTPSFLSDNVPKRRRVREFSSPLPINFSQE